MLTTAALFLTLLTLFTPALTQNYFADDNDDYLPIAPTATEFTALLADLSSISAVEATNPTYRSISRFLATQTDIPSRSISSQISDFAAEIATGATGGGLPFITAFPENLQAPASEIFENDIRVIASGVVEILSNDPELADLFVTSTSPRVRATGTGTATSARQTASGRASSGSPADSGSDSDASSTETSDANAGQASAPSVNSPATTAPSNGVGKVVVGCYVGGVGAVVGLLALL
ncbi:MAG: hypothetical protein Q9164_006817 [Protoblastenia rupestris]